MDGLGLAPPNEWCLDGNLAENWRKWRRNFENYLVAINLVAQPLQENGQRPAANAGFWLRQIVILRHCIGEDSVEQGCSTGGPGVGCGPPLKFIRPPETLPV